MRVFIADNGVVGADTWKKYGADLLISYAFKDRCIKRFNEGFKIFLDSGAFSVWKRGESIDIKQYKDFCLKYQDQIEFAANLDVIPGSWGHVPTHKDIELSAQKSFQNYLYLKDSLKCKVVPVFHQHESVEWLDKILTEIDNDDLVAISPANDQVRESRIQWLDTIWSKMININREPTVNCHAFGVTTPKIIKRYPWYSVDSSTPSQHAANGSVITYNKTGDIKAHSVSRRRTEPYSKELLSEIDRFGFRLQDLCGGQNGRNRVIYNTLVLVELLQSIATNKFTVQQETLI